MKLLMTMLLFCAFVLSSSSCRYREKRETELSVAAAEGNYNKVVQISGENGININEHVKGVDPPLCIASYAGHRDIVEYLISKGADVNLRGENGATPLIEASLGNQPEIVKYLLSKSANRSLSLTDENGNEIGVTALKIAQMKVYQDIVRILQESN